MTQAKCVSGCKGLETEICEKAPRCSYANGEKRQFCRLSRTFKMGRGDCTVRRKTNKNQKVLVIQNFMKNTTSKRRSEFLKAICSDSGFCYALGKNRTKIFKFFDGFVDFKYVNPPIVAIGSPSANGFVKSIRYEKLGYTANAVLKSSTKPNSDNLAYEFLVGMFLNKMGNQFPCFVQTYGLYNYRNDAKWKHARDTDRITTNILKDSLHLYTSLDNYKWDVKDAISDEVCQYSKHWAVLIQHFNNFTTLSDVLENANKLDETWCSFILKELPYILYQIYMPLDAMSKTFTHYDLHDKNIMLYEPAAGKCIQYHYHVGSEVVKFKSRYIVKIIDYGRSFYKNQSQPHSSATDVLKEVCVIDDCNEDDEECGDKSGFRYLTNTLKKSDFFMSSSEYNPSADLRLLHILKNYHRIHRYNAGTAVCGPPDVEIEAFTPIEELLKKIDYGAGLDPGQKKYGTKPIKESGLPNKVNNVGDVEVSLRSAIINNDSMRAFNESEHENLDKICDIHVYSDGRNMKVKMAK